MNHSSSLLLAALLSLNVCAQAAEPAQCSTVNFSDVGWTDITVTTAVTSEVLKALGHKARDDGLGQLRATAAHGPAGVFKAFDPGDADISQAQDFVFLGSVVRLGVTLLAQACHAVHLVFVR